MIIRQLILKSFGKFQNTTIDLRDGLNILYGENEAGKSTLHKFIEAMFYGFYKPNIKNKKLNDEYDRFFPWTNSKEFAGALILQDEKEVRIERSFMKNSDDVIIYDNITGENITETYPYDAVLRIHQPSLKHFGFPVTTYQNTVSISQMKSRTSKDLVHEIKDSMVNLKETGTLELSVKNILKALSDKKAAIGTEKSKKSNYGRTMDRIIELENERAEAIRISEELENLLIEENILFEEIKKLQNEKKNIEFHMNLIKEEEERKSDLKIQTLIKEIDVLKEEMNVYFSFSDLSKEEVNDILLTIKQMGFYEDAARKKKERGRGPLLWVGAIITLSLCLLKIIKPLWIHWWLLFFVVFTDLVLLIIVKRNGQDNLDSKMKEDQAFLQKWMDYFKIEAVQGLKAYLEKFEYYKGLEQEIRVKQGILEEVMKQRAQYAFQGTNHRHLERQEIDENLKGSSYVDLELQLKKKNEGLIQYHSNLSSVKTEIGNKRRRAGRLVEIEEELEARNRALKEMESLLKTYDVVEEGVAAISKDIQDDYSPRLMDKVSKIIQQATQNKYRDVKISSSLELSVIDQELDKLVQVEDLSAGTIDLMYFALRVGLLEITSQDKRLPILLDDSFVQYDEKRCKRILEFLLKLDQQILLFTCHKREVELLKELSEDIHVISLR